MKQIVQNLSSGETKLVEVPEPNLTDQELLIQGRCSLVSLGTEKMLVEFGKGNLLAKAKQQPERVREVIKKAGKDGLLATMDAVKSKLDQPIPLGYCHVGVVKKVGSAVTGFDVGDRVVSNGAHATQVAVPQNLCAKVPDSVTDEDASFVVLASIGLQGVRLLDPTIGETVVVLGLGLIGLLSVQLLKANGCNVICVDLDSSKLDVASQYGATTVNISKGEDLQEIVNQVTAGRGVDGVIIAASTKSSDPVSQAAKACRKRGRIVLVGVTGLNLNRAEFYEKELQFSVSCSYGPGRYDPAYEKYGQDYPVGFVRWTAQRNFEAIIQLMASERMAVDNLISKRVDFEKSPEMYDTLSGDPTLLGIILNYPKEDGSDIELSKRTVKISRADASPANDTLGEKRGCVCGVIGAGNYASRILIPALKSNLASLHTLVSAKGLSASHHGEKNGFQAVSTDANSLFESKDINAIVIASQHDTHAEYVMKGIRAGKNVFVEKPLAISQDELAAIESEYGAAPESLKPCVTVGFNRRFAPHVIKAKQLLESVSEPISIVMTINAGHIPPDHWTQDPSIGGGRIIGEGCHFVDLARFLVGYEIKDVLARSVMSTGGPVDDVVTITLTFSNGSIATIHYFANGGASVPKERIEISCSGRTLQINNYRTLIGYDWPGFKKLGGWKQDKGQLDCAGAFVRAVTNGEKSPIPFSELIEVSRVTIEASEQIRHQRR